MPSDFPPSRWPVSTGADGRWNYSSGGQATPQDQEVLGNDRERRADPGRRGDCRFLPRGDCAQETWNHAIRLRDAPDTQRLPDRQDLRAGTL